MKFLSRGKSLRVGMLQKAKWRRESSPRTVTRMMVIGVFLAIVMGVLLATFRQSLAFLTDNPLYAIAKLDIPQPMCMTAEEVTALSGVAKGNNLLLLPIKEVRKRLMEHPNIKDALVQRILPNVLRIIISEREPLAQISIGKNYLVDAEGAVLTWNEKFAQKDWTLIEGLEPKSKLVDNKIQSDALLDVLQILQQVRGSPLMSRLEIKKVKLAEPGGYLFLTNKDVGLRMGPGLQPTEIKEKFTQLGAVLEDLQKKGVTAQTIDLRFNDVVVTPKHTEHARKKVSPEVSE